MSAFYSYVYSENIDEGLIEKTIDHYQYMWKRTLGMDLKTRMMTFYPQLHLDCAMQLYYYALKAVPIFEMADIGFFRKLAVHVNQISIQKDSKMIRCNDIQEYVYIVLKGKIDIVIAETKMCSLMKGGIFGNLSKLNRIRQKISAVAVVNTDLLYIHSFNFRRIVSNFPYINGYFERVNLLGYEYLQANADYFDEEDVVNISNRDLRKADSDVKGGLHKIFTYTLSQSNKYVKIWDYVTCMYVAPLSTVAFIYVAVIQPFPMVTWEYAMLYVLDAYFVSRIVVSLILSFVDLDLGIVVTDRRVIAVNYLTSFRAFGMDLITLLPIELVPILCSSPQNVVSLCIINRCLRYYFLIRYHNERKERLDATRHIRVLYLVYLCLVFLQLMVALW